MPTKGTDNAEPIYYYQSEDGQSYEAHNVVLQIGETAQKGILSGLSDSLECSFTFSVPKDTARIFWQLIALMPNNWLKQHSYPKRRRRKKL